MDESRFSISAQTLYSRLGTATAPALVDVRRAAAFDADFRMIVGAVRRAPDEVDSSRRDLPTKQSVAVYCVYGHELSQGTRASTPGALRRRPLGARALGGGDARDRRFKAGMLQTLAACSAAGVALHLMGVLS